MSKANISCALFEVENIPLVFSRCFRTGSMCFHDGTQPIGIYEPYERDTVALKPKQTAQQRNWRSVPLLHHFCSGCGNVWWKPKYFTLEAVAFALLQPWLQVSLTACCLEKWAPKKDKKAAEETLVAFVLCHFNICLVISFFFVLFFFFPTW